MNCAIDITSLTPLRHRFITLPNNCTLAQCAAAHVTRHTSHVTLPTLPAAASLRLLMCLACECFRMRLIATVTHHTSHVTRYTSHVTRHTSHITPHRHRHQRPHTHRRMQPCVMITLQTPMRNMTHEQTHHSIHPAPIPLQTRNPFLAHHHHLLSHTHTPGAPATGA